MFSKRINGLLEVSAVTLDEAPGGIPDRTLRVDSVRLGYSISPLKITTPQILAFSSISMMRLGQSGLSAFK